MISNTHEQHIITECFVDTNLIDTISPPSKRHNHQKGNSKISTKMQSPFFSDDFAVGITDKDKREIGYASEFQIIYEDTFFELMKHKTNNKHHFLIFIKPAIERWMENCLLLSNKKFSYFNLPDDFELLKRETKTKTSQKDIKFKSLFTTLKEEKNKPILILKEWIDYFKNHPYDAKTEDLIGIVNQIT